MQLVSKIGGDPHSAPDHAAPRTERGVTHALELARWCESDLRLHHVFTQAAVALAIVDFDGDLIQANPAFREMLGYDETEPLPFDCFAVADPEDPDLAPAWFEKLVRAECKSVHFHKRYLHKLGHEVHASLNISLVREPAGEPLYFVAHVQDETERRRAQWLETDQRLTLEMVAQDKPLPSVLHQLVRLIERQMQGTWACVMLLQDGAIRPFGCNVPAELAASIARRPISFSAGLTCAVRTEYLPTPLVADVETHHAWEDLRGDATRAGVKCCWARTVRGADGIALGLLVVMLPQHRSPSPVERDILETATRLAVISVEHHQTTRMLAHLVRHDPLTGLANRVLFEDRLHQALAAARRNNKPLGLLALDLNRFKHVNDTLGHQAGDWLLQQFSQRLAAKLRECDTLARVGGDEFLAILPQVAGRDEAEAVAGRLMAALASAPFKIAGQSLVVTTSIGIAMYPDDADDTIPLQRAADAAMYRAKEEGRGKTVPISVARSAAQVADHPDIIAKMEQIMKQAHVPMDAGK